MAQKEKRYALEAFSLKETCSLCHLHQKLRALWHIEGGKLPLELNRVLRPDGCFVWSATPVYQKLTEDVEIWKAIKDLTNAMCWDMVSKTKDKLNEILMILMLRGIFLCKLACIRCL